MLKFIKCLLLLYIGLFMSIGKVEAEEPSFSIEPVPSSLQVNNEHTYFDLKAKPNAKEILSVKVYNHSKQELTILGEVNRATTSNNGIVEYGKTDDYDGKIDDSLNYDIKELVKPLKPAITIPAGETGIYKLELVMPDKEVEGILAGGISFQEKKTSKGTDKQESTGLVSKINYKVGLIINGKTDGSKPDIQFLKVFSKTVNQVNSIGITLKNNSSQFINELAIEAKITEDKTKKLIYSGENTNLQMAPNSHFDYSVYITDTRLSPGTYTMDVKVSSGELSWRETKQLIIDDEGTDKVTDNEILETNSSKKNTRKILFAILVSLVLVGISLIAVIVLIRRNKHN